MRIILYLSLVMFIFSCSKRQEITLLKVEKPKNWEILTSDTIISNTFKNHNDSIAKELLTQFKDSKLLYSFIKHPIQRLNNIHPSIRIEIRRNEHETDEGFFNSAQKELNEWSNYFENFKIIDKPKVINFNGVKALYMKVTYSIMLNDTIRKPRSRIYLIPSDMISYQFYFNDELSVDCSKEFENIISEIKFKK